MTPRPVPTPSSLARVLTSSTLLGALVLAGCGTQDALVGLHPAPPEQTASAPLDTEGATAVAARLLAAADAPVEGDAKVAAAARAAILTGDALTVANAEATRGAADPASTELTPEPTPTVVAQSQGRQWPRAILATTLDEPTNTQWLHVMMSPKPDQPFRIAASVPMSPNTELPALGAQLTGAPLLDTTAKNDLPLSPADAVKAYAGALAYPKARPTTAVEVDDPFSVRLKSAAAVQAKALGALATLTTTHSPVLDDAITFRLANGGAVTFALMSRTDAMTVKPKGKELTLPAEYAKLVGKKSVTQSVTLANLEPIVMVVPKTGKAEVIGARDLLVSGKAR